MGEINKPSLRIDWFDGTLIEDTRPGSDTNPFGDEEQSDPQSSSRPQIVEKKPIGFKRLQDISAMRPPALTLEVSHRPGFWNLLDVELKGDFIVLIVKVLANIYKSLEPDEKSRIASQLKSKLEKSIFLNTLKEYVAGLPVVRISEKKMNFQLWNDVELFFNDLIALCEDKYVQNPTKRRHENIRVYPEVRILRTYVSNNRVGHLVDIAWKERSSQGVVDSKKLAQNKQLMFGSLLLFTSDNFETILCATVLDSSAILLSEGYVAVSFQSLLSKSAFTVAYLMVESEVFFEPYHRVLKVLQCSKLDDFPMKRYIVDVQPETLSPSYLTSETIYTVQSSHKPEEICFPVLDEEQWPPADYLGLDSSQMEAYKFALTREFAVIQGPPGTGKTFIGVKIASTLLKNLSLDGTPMLVICYTNHALDQFLEGILGVTKNIIRLGSQSKSKILEPYTLHNLRMKMKSKYSYLYANKRSELERIFKEMIDLQSEIEKCEKEILSYKTIKTHLKIGDQLYELNSSKDDPVLGWLFNDNEENSEIVELEEWERLDELSVDDYIDTCFSEKWAKKEIDSMRNSLRYVKDVTDDQLVVENMADKFEEQIDKIWQRLRCFRKNIMSIPNSNTDIPKVDSLYKLTSEQRWRVYHSAVAGIKNKLSLKMDDLLLKHNTCNDELNEVATLIDGELMKCVRVVGVTTTTAARRHDLMKKLLSPIVIIEEAAEVLEGHIVASLTNNCQHLILIGDHKQLRPTAAHYKLAKEYNLEISLFERMIRNGIHARTLTTQRRMRPNCVQLLVPTIYERLDSHPYVFGYPDVRGMKDNLFFVTHDVFEDSDSLEESWSHKNSLEAKWCVALANYLREMKYASEDITVLSTYTGQVSLIKEISKNYKLLRDVKVTPVDNYQGEENRIVILSLVRSNRDGKIGFLAAVNRICVALSRAKEGFYLFGNMNVLTSASSVWRAINDKLVAQNAVGRELTICCDTHRDNVLKITDPDELNDCFSGSCLRVCNKK
ncbi:NFX1-type zinc finger-containing protein 1-like isoform X2 [Plodia interpunctella]|uniref:NFX1-type zinc finger-containing protein 1-like isoform X2 n=1 Tax=Plodia interpunctella TaxID=58824 RepID=UPI002368C6AD|nr:NFX1-type zinc finger-containing protein 1-like isoform X2 [Plodia interpunctella]